MGRKEDILEKVRQTLEPLAGPEGLELVDVEITGAMGRTILRLYIDRLRDAAGRALPRPITSQVALGLSADEKAAPVVQDDGEPDEVDGDDEGEDGLGSGLGSEATALEVIHPDPRFDGVSLDDCTHFSRISSAALDVEDPLEGAYDLEVSSPGLDRPLRTEDHFVRYAGKKVRLKTYAPVPECDNRKTFVGQLKGMDAGKVLVEVDGKVFAVPFAQVSKANIEPVFSF